MTLALRRNTTTLKLAAPMQEYCWHKPIAISVIINNVAIAAVRNIVLSAC